jgi:hypothetical protein
VHEGPALHDVVPVWHASEPAHADPSTQLTHAPAEQTWSAPQKVPFGAPTQLPQTPP